MRSVGTAGEGGVAAAMTALGGGDGLVHGVGGLGYLVGRRLEGGGGRGRGDVVVF